MRTVSADASARVTISNKLGLHARPAMIFVELASDFRSDIGVRRTDQDDGVDGKSIMQMMMLAATQGTEIEITAVGADAAEAVRQLVALVKSKFEED
jgi:phosphocarrier protein HPr